MFSLQIKIFLERVVLEIFILLFLLEKEGKKISLSKPGHTKKEISFSKPNPIKRKKKKCRIWKNNSQRIQKYLEKEMRRIQSYEEKRFFPERLILQVIYMYYKIIYLFVYLFVYYLI